ncbi:MAG: hypothetical protein O2923_03005 [Verrucomicrobia bacterium]|nr:hypothetical protein [Verrucomicrobiota bacterium]MDA1086404.1 hypothetical protein [Verrucomicrobiota bacterium]
MAKSAQDRSHSKDADPAVWFVRPSGAKAYGPVTFQQLYTWAIENRIAHGATVSNDGTVWAPAESVSALRMEWMVHRSDGRAFGPFNLRATPALVRAGILPGDATLVHVRTGKRLTVAEVIAAASDTQTSTPPSAAADAPPVVDTSLQKNLEKEHQLRLEKEAEVTRLIEEFAAEADASSTLIDELKGYLDRQTAEIERLQDEMKSRDEKPAGPDAESLERIKALEASLQAEEARHADMEKQAAGTQQELSNRIEALSGEKDDLVAKVSQVERAAQAAREETTAAKRTKPTKSTKKELKESRKELDVRDRRIEELESALSIQQESLQNRLDAQAGEFKGELELKLKQAEAATQAVREELRALKRSQTDEDVLDAQRADLEERTQSIHELEQTLAAQKEQAAAALAAQKDALEAEFEIQKQALESGFTARQEELQAQHASGAVELAKQAKDYETALSRAANQAAAAEEKLEKLGRKHEEERASQSERYQDLEVRLTQTEAAAAAREVKLEERIQSLSGERDAVETARQQLHAEKEEVEAIVVAREGEKIAAIHLQLEGAFAETKTMLAQLEEARQLQEKTQAEVEAVRSELATYREVADGRLATNADELRTATEKRNAAERERTRVLDQLAALNEALESSQKRLQGRDEDLARKSKEFEQRCQKLESERDVLRDRGFVLDRRVVELTSSGEKLQEALARADERVAELESSVAADASRMRKDKDLLEAELKTRTEQNADLRAQVDRTQGALQASGDSAKEAKSRQHEAQGTVRRLQGELSGLAQELTAARSGGEKKIAARDMRVNELEREIEARMAERDTHASEVERKERKLDDTQKQLGRVQAELEKALGELADQKAQAEETRAQALEDEAVRQEEREAASTRFRTLEAELKHREVELAGLRDKVEQEQSEVTTIKKGRKHKEENLRGDIKRLKQDIETLGDHLNDNREALSQTRAELQQEREKAALQERGRKQELHALQKELKAARGEHARAAEEMGTVEVQASQKDQDIAALTSQIQALQSNSQPKEDVRVELQRQREITEREIAKREAEFAEQSQSTKAELNRHIAELRKQIDAATNDARAKTEELEKVRKESGQRPPAGDADAEALREQLTEASSALEKARGEVEGMRAELDAEQTRRQEVESARDQAAADVAAAREQLEADAKQHAEAEAALERAAGELEDRRTREAETASHGIKTEQELRAAAEAALAQAQEEFKKKVADEIQDLRDQLQSAEERRARAEESMKHIEEAGDKESAALHEAAATLEAERGKTAKLEGDLKQARTDAQKLRAAAEALKAKTETELAAEREKTRQAVDEARKVSQMAERLKKTEAELASERTRAEEVEKERKKALDNEAREARDREAAEARLMAEQEQRTNAESALRRAEDERLSQVLALEAKIAEGERDAEQVTQEIKRLETQLQETAQKEPFALAAATRATIVTTPKTWHVRLEDRRVIGPVNFIELREWADQCRIYPGHEVSDDQTSWRSAESVPELGMFWKIKLPDGTDYGPLNLFAVRDLVDNGSIAPDAEVTHVDKGLTVTAGAIPSPGVVAVITGSENPVQRNAEVTSRPEWHLKLDDDNIMGPVSLDELATWAAQCRIYPGHQVSKDKSNWTAVETVPELKMEWTVPLVDGSTYGPLNLFAIPDLIADGAVASDAKVHHKLTRLEIPAERIPARELLEFVREPDVPQQEEALGVEELAVRFETALERIEQLEKEIHSLHETTSAPPAETVVPRPPPLSIKAELQKRLDKVAEKLDDSE